MRWHLRLHSPRYYFRRAVRAIAQTADPIHPPRAETLLTRSESLELLKARWDLRQALDEVPRDQSKVNRLRRQVEALEQPDAIRRGTVR